MDMDFLEDIVISYVLTQKKEFLTTALEYLLQEEIDKEDEISKRNKNKINLHTMSDRSSLYYFRFNRHDLMRLKLGLRIPDVIKTENGSVFRGDEALCVLLRRLAYPNRLKDLEGLFGREPSELSRIFNYMLDYVETNFGFLTDSMDLFWLERNFLNDYAEKIAEKGSPLTHCVGFIDDIRTFRPMCRPTRCQNAAYSGHKRQHGMKFQSVVTPNGLISNLYGPVEGSRHDSYMLAVSGLLPKLELKFDRGHLPTFCLYGDPAYPNRPELLSPFKGNLTFQKAAFNTAMSSVRQSVEWEFGKIIKIFAFCDFKKNLKVFLQPVSTYYKVAAILTNCHSCVNESQTSLYFGTTPPTLEQYLANTL